MFFFHKGDGDDTILDFTIGGDKIAVHWSLSVDMFYEPALDLLFSQGAEGAELTFNVDDKVTLIGVNAEDLSWSDFVTW